MKNILFATLALFAMNACSPAPKISNSHVKTVAFHGTAWDHTQLSVCWEISSPGTDSYRTHVREILTKGFEKSVISFLGWETCASDKEYDVRMFIYDDSEAYGTAEYESLIAELRQEALTDAESSLKNPNPSNSDLSLGHPRARGYGNQNAGKRANLLLNRTFKDAMPGFEAIYSTFTEVGKFNGSLSVAIHEMGHVLGLKHEDGHPDTACSEFKEGAKSEDLVTPYNPFSIMSRCYYRSYNYNLGYILPNAKDIEGLNAFYKGSALSSLKEK
jgi:hypothetical protein